jgi:hypothetical protein
MAKEKDPNQGSDHDRILDLEKRVKALEGKKVATPPVK